MTPTAAPETAAPPRRRHTFADLYHERTRFRFIEHSKRYLVISLVLVAVSAGALLVRELNLGIDFEGGTAWQVTVDGQSPDVAEVRDVLRPLGFESAKVTVVGDDDVRVQAEVLDDPEVVTEVTDALAGYAGQSAEEVSVSRVGPTWGERVTRKALQALVVFFLLLAAYLTIRFEWKMAGAAITAVIHDIIVTVGVYAVFQFEVTPATVTAFLTILGFSLYDTVVVFDKVRENQTTLLSVGRATYSQMVDRSLNQVLMRSLSTSLVAVLPVLSLLVVGAWIMGASSLEEFGIALLVGLLIGSYSSIFVAAPLLAWWKERESQYRALRERIERSAARAATATPAGPSSAGDGAPAGPAGLAGPAGVGEEALAGGARGATATATPATPGSSSGPITPRPRQPRRRKRA